MAVPKKRRSKSRQNKRRHATSLKPPGLVKCSHCGSLKLPHYLCQNCGYYADRQVIQLKT